MDLTKGQISELMCKHAEREHGLHDLFEIMLASMIVADVFRTGERTYTRDMARGRWQDLCDRWGKVYRSFKAMRDNLYYMDYFTYLDFDYRIQSMIYTTNWIERLQKDFGHVTKMRGAMPNDESVLTLIGKTAMDKNSYGRQLPRIDCDKTLFPV